MRFNACEFQLSSFVFSLFTTFLYSLTNQQTDEQTKNLTCKIPIGTITKTQTSFWYMFCIIIYVNRAG